MDSSPEIRPHRVMACPGCDLLLEPVEVTPRHKALCPRCGSRLYHPIQDSVRKTLALSLTGLLLYLPANFMPLMTFDVLGTDTSTSIFASALSMFAQHQTFVGTIVVLTSLFFPLLTLTLLCGVSFGLYRSWQAPWMPLFLRCHHHLTEWAMQDVYLIGVFITIIKMSHMATIEFNEGFFCFIGLVLATIAAQSVIDYPLFWSLMERNSTESGPGSGKPLAGLTAEVQTAREAGLALCHTCHKIVPLKKQHEGKQFCPRCGETLHFRKADSIGRTWALVITAAIFSFPANLLPIMEVEYLGVPDKNTIMDGIIYFFQEGSYGIGAVILTASILVPMFKIIGLTLILLSIHFHWQTWLRHKSIMFRFIQFIGRWSMLDIFVIALLCALVRFGYLSTINVAPAAFYFTGVVLATMFSAISFDPRLLWDATAAPATRKTTYAATSSS